MLENEDKDTEKFGRAIEVNSTALRDIHGSSSDSPRKKPTRGAGVAG